ncbi:MAG TPA: FG-GAP-like repeat-containing protein, partial [bacterium]|nr:FG-GAP-like repeat-containing protein [bacterium]
MKHVIILCILFVLGMIMIAEPAVRANQVTSVIPSPNSNAAPMSDNLTVTYDEALNGATVNASTFKVFSGFRAPVSGSFAVNLMDFTFDPVSNFFPGAVIAASCTSGIESGEVPGVPFVWQFRTAAGAGPGTFVPSAFTFPSGRSDELDLGDLGGDGDLDLFVGNALGSDRVYLNDGSGQFTSSGQTFPGTGTRGVALGDLDDDGDLDAFVVTSSSGPDVIWLNDGTGTFTNAGQSFPYQNSTDVELGDLDGDGDLDAFITNSVEYSKVLLNDGSAMFSSTGQDIESLQSYDVVLGDLDGDGDLDAGIGNYAGFQYDHIWLNDGAATFTQTAQNLGDLGTVQVLFGDVDSDGDLDMVSVVDGWKASRLWLNNGSGSFSDSGQDIAYNDYSRSGDLADVDGDGDLDLIFSNFNMDNTVWLNNGSGTYTESPHTYIPTASLGMAVGDADGDG